MNISGLAEVKTHWRVVFGATIGWALDSFDFTILLFLMPHLRDVFHVGLSQMAFVVTATGLAKVLGTVGWGRVADRYGRKVAFMAAVVWFSCASGLSGLAWSYASFVALRILFGIGFGGEWTASVSLMLETVPAAGRALASGIMVAGYELGFMLSALAFRFVFPHVGWRWMFFLGVVPALLALFIRRNVAESPSWVARQRSGQRAKAFVFNPAVAQAWAFSAGMTFMLWAVQVLYPTFLLTIHHLDSSQIFPYVLAFSIGSIIGKPLSGYCAGRFGERPTVFVFMLITIPSTALYVLVDSHVLLGLGALNMGLFANGLFGILPLYQARRFPVESRATGIGISHGMTATSVFAPFLIALITPTFGLQLSMAGFIVGGALLLAALSMFNTNRWMPNDDMTAAGEGEAQPPMTPRPARMSSH